ncbi:MAG: hypothetical protein AAGF97_18945 [Planctomycetota bacterium]
MLIAAGGVHTLIALLYLLGRSASEGFEATRQLQRELLDSRGRMTPAEQTQGWREVKQRWETFTESERRELMEDFERHEQRKWAKFRQLRTDAERDAFLDAELAVWADELQRKRGGDQVATKRGRDTERAVATQQGQKKEVANWKEAKERHYLDSTSPEIRAYHAALKKRWFEKYGPK